MQNQGKELTSINFEDLIGGPLMAVIKAQEKAAGMTANFVQTFAFSQSGGKTQLKTVAFDFSQVLDTELAGKLSGVTTIKVPLLTIIPIPYIRVESMTIDFNVDLHSTAKTTLSASYDFGGSVGVPVQYVTLQGSVTSKNTLQRDTTVDDTYSMHVNVRAVQDQMPGGMSQVLGIFQNVIGQQAALIQTIMAAQVKKLTEESQKALNPATPTPPG